MRYESFRDFEKQGWENKLVTEKYQQHIARVTSQSAEALLDAANVGRGSRVLEVACGSGYASAIAFARGAVVTGVDFSTAQIELAHASHHGPRFECADAEALPYQSAAFDSVVCAFGLCHFPHPAVALREAIRVLKPGGYLAFSVWDIPQRAIGFGAIHAALNAHASTSANLPEGPDFFLFSDPVYCTCVLQETGFESVAYRHVPQTWRLDNPDDLFFAIVDGSVRAAAAIRAQSEQKQSEIMLTMRNTVSEYRVGDRYELPMPAMVVSAQKP